MPMLRDYVDRENRNLDSYFKSILMGHYSRIGKFGTYFEDCLSELFRKMNEFVYTGCTEIDEICIKDGKISSSDDCDFTFFIGKIDDEAFSMLLRLKFNDFEKFRSKICIFHVTEMRATTVLDKKEFGVLLSYDFDNHCAIISFENRDIAPY